MSLPDRDPSHLLIHTEGTVLLTAASFLACPSPCGHWGQAGRSQKG
nr:MAG TPA_asm: hypothetical protein [Caudoviricetes sp.]